MRFAHCGHRWLPFALVLATIAGCGHDGLQRLVIHGTVTYQGKPIEKGHIDFRPTEAVMGPICGAEIVAGKYEAHACGGVAIGRYRAEIMAFRTLPLPSGKTEADFDQGPPREQYIPAKYNHDSELKVEITPGGPKDFSFDLK